MRPCLFGGPFTEPRRHDSGSLTRCCTRFIIIHAGNANKSGITVLRLSAHRHRRAHTKLSIFRYRHEEKQRDTHTHTRLLTTPKQTQLKSQLEDHQEVLTDEPLMVLKKFMLSQLGQARH